MDKDKLMNFFITHQGKIIGTLIGFLAGLFLLTLGFFKTLVLSICIAMGYYLGKKVDNKEDIIQFIERLLKTHGKK
ncbi:MAG: DUF2273 domain-containing protein [Lutispora sp.]|jgi:uncharacterized membrane protein|uniref:DUF2273 domain-containing protein n=1 Tax=Lutispora sp. TaxID=2828727 RepID=UPI00356B2B16